ncbi:unnamed protein product [Lota lota]
MKMAAPSQTASELPLKELLALYGYEMPGQLLQPGKDQCHLAAGLPHITLDKDQVTKDMFAGDEGEDPSADDDLAPSYTSNTSDLLRRLRGGEKHTDVGSSEEGSDSASVPSNKERKDIMVGSIYQAQIPPLSPYSFHGRAYDGDDQLLWTPGVLPVQEVEGFLRSAQTPGGQEVAPYTNAHGDTVRDNEQALYELVKCNFNAEEALRRLHFNVKVFNDELCSWSEEECRGFQQGYRAYGKNFHLIQANKVRTRSVGECVQFYYMWKKSERHECFTQQATKMGHRKFTLQSGNMEDADPHEDLGPLENHGNTKASSHKPLGAQRMNLAPSTAQRPDKPEEEGRPRRRRTPRFLLKSGCRRDVGQLHASPPAPATAPPVTRDFRTSSGFIRLRIVRHSFAPVKGQKWIPVLLQSSADGGKLAVATGLLAVSRPRKRQSGERLQQHPGNLHTTKSG